jgi:hypothetical protein
MSQVKYCFFVPGVAQKDIRERGRGHDYTAAGMQGMAKQGGGVEMWKEVCVSYVTM